MIIATLNPLKALLIILLLNNPLECKYYAIMDLEHPFHTIVACFHLVREHQ